MLWIPLLSLRPHWYFFLLKLSLPAFKKEVIWDFLGSTVDRNPLANAGDMVRSLVQEDSTCCGAIRPVCHNYWAHTLEPRSNYWAHVLQLLKPLHLEPMLRNKRGHKISSQHTAARERLHSTEDLVQPKKEWIPCLFASTCTLYLSQLSLLSN